MTENSCYKCKYSQSIPGDAHTKCGHPDLKDGLDILSAISVLHTTETKAPFIVKGSTHGIKNGWFFWPLNFDPVWLERCDGFTPSV